MQAIEEEVAKNVKAAEMAKVDPAAKREQDVQAWKEWIQMYSERLERERACGACDKDRIKAMNAANPKVILRNWVAQVANDAASRGDYSVVCPLINNSFVMLTSRIMSYWMLFQHRKNGLQVAQILKLLEEPYKDWSEDDLSLPLTADGSCTTWRADKPPPPMLASLKCSCSS